MKCPKCGASQMFKINDINSSVREDIFWCICCGLEGKPEELEAKAKAIAKRVNHNDTA